MVGSHRENYIDNQEVLVVMFYVTLGHMSFTPFAILNVDKSNVGINGG